MEKEEGLFEDWRLLPADKRKRQAALRVRKRKPVSLADSDADICGCLCQAAKIICTPPDMIVMA